jgi:threonine aldolase
MHLDGARLLNALVEQKISPEEYVKPFDTVSFCLSKGMGCPLGSVLLGSEKDIWFARNMRKLVGGGMRQAGLTAACALVALEDWEEKLSEDNANARFLASELDKHPLITCPSIVQTNMFSFSLDKKITKKGGYDHISFCGLLKEKYNILVFPSFQNDAIRVVTHRDVNRDDMVHTAKAIFEEIKEF